MRRCVNFSNNETISVRTDTFGVTIWLRVSQSTLSLQDPFVFYTDQIRTLNAGVVGIAILAFFKSLMVTLISALYQKQHCFWFTDVLGTMLIKEKSDLDTVELCSLLSWLIVFATGTGWSGGHAANWAFKEMKRRCPYNEFEPPSPAPPWGLWRRSMLNWLEMQKKKNLREKEQVWKSPNTDNHYKKNLQEFDIRCFQRRAHTWLTDLCSPSGVIKQIASSNAEPGVEADVTIADVQISYFNKLA